MSKVVVDVRRQKSISAKTVAANKDRLKALASAIESDNPTLRYYTLVDPISEVTIIISRAGITYTGLN